MHHSYSRGRKTQQLFRAESAPEAVVWISTRNAPRGGNNRGKTELHKRAGQRKKHACPVLAACEEL